MKGFLFFILSFFLLPFHGSAEYNGHFIDFQIHLKNGKSVTGHCYLSDISYQAKEKPYKKYLESRPEIILIDDYGPVDEEHYAYHQYRLTYKFQWSDSDSGKIYTLANKKSIAIEEVDRIEITEMIEYTYSIVIINPLVRKDEKWMQLTPFRKYSLSGELNMYHIYLHEESPKLKRELEVIEREKQTFYARITLIEKELEGIDGADRQPVEKQLNELIEKREEWIGDVLNRLMNYKVVIIGYLSC